jgi:DNA replicative helicase MCM subunit Mcm2 (Cdc46/Mcm family)
MDISILASTAIGLILPHLKDIVGSLAGNLTSEVKESLKEKIKALFKRNKNDQLEAKLKEAEQEPTEQNVKDLQATLKESLEQAPLFKEELESILEEFAKQGDSYTQQTNVGRNVETLVKVGKVDGNFNLNTRPL